MKLLSQTTSLRVEVVVTLGQEAQEEESQVSQGTDEALMINLETVFLNQVEVAQDQVVDLEDQVTANRTLAELEDQVTAANRTLAELEDLSEVDLEDQILAGPEDQAAAAKDLAVKQQINHIIKNRIKALI